MKKVLFIVSKGTIGGFGNRQFKKGESCTSEDFSPRVSNSLIESGHLKVVEGEKENSTTAQPNEFDGITYDGKTFDELGKKDIVAELKGIPVDFKASDSKAVLFKLLVATAEELAKADEGGSDEGGSDEGGSDEGGSDEGGGIDEGAFEEE